MCVHKPRAWVALMRLVHRLAFEDHESSLNRLETEAQGGVRTWSEPRMGEWQSQNLKLRLWAPSAVLLTVQPGLLVWLLYLSISQGVDGFI